MAMRMLRTSRRIAPALGFVALPLLMLAGCGPTTKVAQAPIENIPAPLPDNLPLIEVPPPAPVLIGANKGEDLWHLRSGLNVAVLLCQGPDNPALVANYNQMLRTHKGLLSEAAQIEVNLFKNSGNRKWQDAYDDHMTKVYNSYSRTLTREAYCSSSKKILADAANATAEAFNTNATVMLWELNRSSGLPDPDGELARRSAASLSTPATAGQKTATVSQGATAAR